MIETPITDGAVRTNLGVWTGGIYVDADVSRRIERELIVARYERERAEAGREEVIKILNGIFALLDPTDTRVGDKTMRFVNPHAAEVLHALSDRIRAIPEAMRNAGVSNAAALKREASK